MNKHTPGPWYFGKKGKTTQHIDGGKGVVNESWTGFAKVYVVVDGEPSETGKANARLIAAAPEMLQMLRYCHQWLQGNEPGRAQAIGECIAKATGETT